jgi:hypothetical protein
MESAEITDFDDGDGPSERLHHRLGVAEPWLLSNFGRLVFPGNVSDYYAAHGVDLRDLVLAVTEGPDPLADMTLEELVQLVSGARRGGCC